MTTLALGKPPRELHAKIVAMVTIVEATKQRDFSGRLKSELVYTMYVNTIAVLCIEVYKLEIPLLTSPDVRELTRTAVGNHSNNFCMQLTLRFSKSQGSHGNLLPKISELIIYLENVKYYLPQV